jgi:hypothetical protein
MTALVLLATVQQYDQHAKTHETARQYICDVANHRASASTFQKWFCTNMQPNGIHSYALICYAEAGSKCP